MSNVIPFPRKERTLANMRLILGLHNALPKVKWEVPEYEVRRIPDSLLRSLLRKLKRMATQLIRILLRRRPYEWD